MQQTWIYLAIAGAIGTLLRFGLSYWVQRLFHGLKMGAFPWGTLTVNMLGCFLFGLVWSLAEERGILSGTLRNILLVGFMGAFTTFSTFAFETGQMLRDAQWLLMLGNLLIQNVFGLVFLFLGFAVARAI